MDTSQLKKEQDIVTHLGDDYERFLGAVVPPIFMNTLHVTPKEEIGQPREFVYGRLCNPTTDIFEKKVAALECADKALAFGSGMAAISSALLGFLKKGDHVICIDSVYGPTRAFITQELFGFGVEHTFVDGRDVNNFNNAIKENTKVIYLESPATMTFYLQDLKAVAALAKEHSIVTMIDSSCASPIFQKPITLGIDLSIHTVSKYMGGHSDVIAGVVAGSSEKIARVHRVRELYGGILGPMEAWLATRGLRTMPIKVKEHARVCNIISKKLDAHPMVKVVNNPMLESHPQHALAKQQMIDMPGPISFLLDASYEESLEFVKRLKFFNIGPSWGGYESMVTLPQKGSPIFPDGLIRIFFGLEDIDTLWLDLSNSLDLIKK